MKLSPIIFSILVCVFALVEVEGRCRKRIVKYIQPAPISVPQSYFNFQSPLEDEIITRDAGISYIPPDRIQRPNLSCLLFSDDGCKVSCDLTCDINGCRESDGFCSQKLYCKCNEIYVVKNQPVTADQFKKLTFEDLWTYKFKPANTSANLKNRIFQSDELYGFVMPLLQNPHKSGRDVKEALLKRYPKLSSAKNLQPREHGIKGKLFGNGAGAGGENLHQYIQNMMNSVQENSVYDRLNHTRYMRRLINLIKDIDNKEDLSYILRQIRQTGNDRLFERLRRYLMKRGYYFDSDLKPISKKAGFCKKKKVKCRCHKKFKSKPKRFFYGNGATSFNYGNDDDDDDDDDDAGADWIEAEGEDGQIEMALIEELIGSNDSEAKYPSNTILEEQPVLNPSYQKAPEEEIIPSRQDTAIDIPAQMEEVIEIIPQNNVEFIEKEMMPPNNTPYVITPNAGVSEYPTISSQQPTIFLQKSNYPEYGKFFNSPNENEASNKPIREFPTNTFVTYVNQKIPSSSIPESVYYEELAQPNNEFLQNTPYPSTSFENSQYFGTPDSTIFITPQNQVKPFGVTSEYQHSELFDQPLTTPAQKLDEYPKPTTVSQNPEKSSETIIKSPKLISQNLDQSPQTVTTKPQILEGPSTLPLKSQNIEQIKTSMPLAIPQATQQILTSTTAPAQVIDSPPKPSTLSQDLGNLMPTITENLTSPNETVPSPQTIEKSSTKITSPPQNLLQQFVTEKPSPKIPESSPYLSKSSASLDTNTFDIPDAVPSVESLFVKHNQSPEKISTTTMLSPAILSSSYSSPLKSPEVIKNSGLDDIQTKPMKISEPETPSPSSLQFYEIQSPPVMQKPKEKVYYQLLMDENGNIIKSANYKYPGQPTNYQDMQQFSSVSPLQHSSTIYQEDQPIFDKFDKQKILQAAKSKPGQSTVLDYDLNSTDDIPVFDIPSDIDMLSGTFGVSPEGVVVEHDDIDGDTWEIMPKSYTTNDGSYEYSIPNDMETMDRQSGSQYVYENDGYNKYDIPFNPEVTSSTKEWQTLTPPSSQYVYEINPEIPDSNKEWQVPKLADSQYEYEIERFNKYELPISSEVTIPSNAQPGPSQYPFEIDGDNHQVQTNDGLTLNYEDNSPSHNNNWSSYSINDSDDVKKFPIDSTEHSSTFDNNPGTISSNYQVTNHNSNSNEGWFNIDIFDASEEPDENNLAQKIELGNTTKQSQTSYNKFSSSGNEGIHAIKDNASKLKKSKSSSNSAVETSSKSSTKVTTNNSIPIKSTSHIDNFVKDGKDNSASCDILVDPEDDLLNF